MTVVDFIIETKPNTDSVLALNITAKTEDGRIFCRAMRDNVLAVGEHPKFDGVADQVEQILGFAFKAGLSFAVYQV